MYSKNKKQSYGSKHLTHRFIQGFAILGIFGMFLFVIATVAQTSTPVTSPTASPTPSSTKLPPGTQADISSAIKAMDSTLKKGQVALNWKATGISQSTYGAVDAKATAQQKNIPVYILSFTAQYNNKTYTQQAVVVASTHQTIYVSGTKLKTG